MGEVASDLAPPAVLAQVGRLAQSFRAAGCRVCVGDRAGTGARAPGLDLTAYRLVQEGLTNTLRQAHFPEGAGVCVDLAREGAIELAVRDDGVGAVAPNGFGNGLTGMREDSSLDEAIQNLRSAMAP